jgi:hypothetical protein
LISYYYNSSGFWYEQKPPKKHRKTTEKPPKNHRKPLKKHFEKPLRAKTPYNFRHGKKGTSLLANATAQTPWTC